MNGTSAQDTFKAASNQGKREYMAQKSAGKSGHLTSLEGLLQDVEIVSTVPIGLVEVPLKKIVGTYSNSRRLAFASNFMPLSSGQSDFQEKWTRLCEAHLNEGIRDPIKVYEYMNWYYVLEGNKRVSVLKYFGAWSFEAEVIRLVPKRDEHNIQSLVYYEFMDFYRKTGLISIWFSRTGRYGRLLDYLEDWEATTNIYSTKYKNFEHFIYNPFRRVYLAHGGGGLACTTGDAFVLYTRFYGIPKEINEGDLQATMKTFLLEVDRYERGIGDLSVDDDDVSTSVMGSLGSMIRRRKKLRVAFVHTRTAEGSGWTYSHELGRKHVERTFEGQIETLAYFEAPEGPEAYQVLKEVSSSGVDVVFTTAEVLMKPTMRCALDHPNILYFNCSANRPYVHLTNYFGRTYEPRFLAGMIAGSVTKSDVIGYTATSSTPETVAGINAFTTGCRMMNPAAKVVVAWTHKWNDPTHAMSVSRQLIDRGADVVTNKNEMLSREDTWEFGIYSMLCTIDPETGQPDAYLASPIWKWGRYYEKILQNVLNGTYRAVTDMFNNNPKVINFWWGMASGVIDLYYSKSQLPKETIKMVQHFRKWMINGNWHPFMGPIYDQEGNLRYEEGQIPSAEEILTMDWFVEGVEVLD